MMNILSATHSHIFLLAAVGFLAAGPDIDKAGTGFSALYNVAIAQWCVRNALCCCEYRYPTSGFDTRGD